MNYHDAREDHAFEPVSLEVPCNGCTLCCQNDAVRIHPEMGDDPKLYKTEMIEGRLCLAHATNGNCVYLIRGKGCSIHDRRPAVCRELDCRVFLLRFTARERRFLVSRGMLGAGVIAAAKKLKQKHGIPRELRELVQTRDHS